MQIDGEDSLIVFLGDPYIMSVCVCLGAIVSDFCMLENDRDGWFCEYQMILEHKLC
jgi:hypothetical protein